MPDKMEDQYVMVPRSRAERYRQALGGAVMASLVAFAVYITDSQNLFDVVAWIGIAPAVLVAIYCFYSAVWRTHKRVLSPEAVAAQREALTQEAESRMRRAQKASDAFWRNPWKRWGIAVLVWAGLYFMVTETKVDWFVGSSGWIWALLVIGVFVWTLILTHEISRWIVGGLAVLWLFTSITDNVKSMSTSAAIIFGACIVAWAIIVSRNNRK